MVRTLDPAKRSAIITAAKTIIFRDGYVASKMTDIAAEAGVAPGTLYLYFDNKESLASAIGEEFFSRLIDEFGTMILKIDDPDGIEALVDWALETGDRERLVLAMVRDRKNELKSKQESRQRLVSRLSESLADLISRGVIRKYSDTNALAQMVLALMRRVLMAHAVFQDENTDELKAGAVEVLQHALFDDVSLAACRLVKRQQHQT